MNYFLSSNHPKLPLYLFVGSLVFLCGLPSGTFNGFPLKTIFLGINFISILCVVQWKHLSKSFFMVLFPILFFLFLYMFFGFFEYGFNALKEFQLISMAVLLSFFYANVFSRYLPIKYYYFTFIFCLLLIFAIKVYFLFAGFMFGYKGMALLYSSLFDSEVVTMELPYNFVRIYIQFDILAAFFPLIYFWFINNRIKNKTAYDFVFLALSLLIVLLSFSRYLIFVNFLGLFFVMLSGRYWVLNVAIVGLLFLVCFMYYFDYVFDFIKLRFLSNANQQSDMIRNEQADVLVNLFFKEPLFGNGLGAYDPNHIRSESNPFSYEQQVLSLLPKFGLIGSLVIFCVSFLYMCSIYIKKQWTVMLVAILFFMSGVFNPYLFSTNVILIYIFLFISIQKKRHACV